MVAVTLLLDPVVAAFYQAVADRSERPLEAVLAEALFRLAGSFLWRRWIAEFSPKSPRGNCFFGGTMI